MVRQEAVLSIGASCDDDISSIDMEATGVIDCAVSSFECVCVCVCVGVGVVKAESPPAIHVGSMQVVPT